MSVYNHYNKQGKIIKENFAQMSVPGSKGNEILLKNQAKIQGALRLALGVKTDNQFTSVQYSNAYAWIMKHQVKKAKDIQRQAEDAGEKISEEIALERAGDYWASRIAADNDATKNQTNSSAEANDGIDFTKSGNNDGTFLSNTWDTPTVSYSSTIAEIQANQQKAVSFISNKSGDVFKEKIPGIKVDNLDYSKESFSNGYHPIFNELEQYDRYDRTPYQLLNAQRVAHGLKPYNWEEEDPDAHAANERWGNLNPEIKALFKTGSELSIDKT